MELSKKQIDIWWLVAVALVVIGAGLLHIGLGVMSLGVLLGLGVIRIEWEKENG